jgi:nucleoside diphosphate kinase
MVSTATCSIFRNPNVGVLGLLLTKDAVKILARKKLLATVFLKPEVERIGKTDETIRAFEKAGLWVALEQRCKPPREFFERHYEEHADSVVKVGGAPTNKRNMLVGWMMQEWPITLMYVTAAESSNEHPVDVPKKVELIVGHSSNADKCNPGTLRYELGGSRYAAQFDPGNPDAGYRYTMIHRVGTKPEDNTRALVVKEAMNFATQIAPCDQLLLIPQQVIQEHDLLGPMVHAIKTSNTPHMAILGPKK